MDRCERQRSGRPGFPARLARDARRGPSAAAPGGTVVPYPSWLSAGDNAWQLTAATLVGLMSIPAVAVLYGGLVQRRWVMNTVLMVFSTFCLTLIIWVLWAFRMGFGSPWISAFVGTPGAIVGAGAEQARAVIPSLAGLTPKFRFAGSSLAYCQFLF